MHLLPGALSVSNIILEDAVVLRGGLRACLFERLCRGTQGVAEGLCGGGDFIASLICVGAAGRLAGSL